MSIADPKRAADAVAEAPNDQIFRSHARVAYRLASLFEGRLLFVPNIGWLAWDGTRWAEADQGEPTQAVLDTIRAGWADALGNATLQADLKSAMTSAGLKGTLAIAEGLPHFVVPHHSLDADPFLLNVANGTLDLRDMKLRPHDPADKITKIAGAAYDPGAVGRTWEAFLNRSLPDLEVRDYLRRYVGLALCGKVLKHRLAILTGYGGNGKGVFIHAVHDAFGGYAVTGDRDLFSQRDGAVPTGTLDLRGARWVSVQETEKGKALNEALVKSLTGGDRLKARRMRQDFIEFDPSHMAVLVTNELPAVSGTDNGLWRRLRVVPFDVVIPEAEQDDELEWKLRAETEAVLAWAVQGWVEYRESGFAEPARVVYATDSYRSEVDHLGRFIQERCVVAGHASALFADLWDAWEAWVYDPEGGAAEVHCGTKKWLTKELSVRGYRTVVGPQGKSKKEGIGLKATP